MIRRPLLNSLFAAAVAQNISISTVLIRLWYGPSHMPGNISGHHPRIASGTHASTWNVPSNHGSKCGDIHALTVKFHGYNVTTPVTRPFFFAEKFEECQGNRQNNRTDEYSNSAKSFQSSQQCKENI
jgi:hypothetical protein